MKKILVTGATGHLGNAVVNALLKKIKATEIAALVRDPEKENALELEAKNVELRRGDYDDYKTLIDAFQGIEKLYFVSGSDVVKRLKQHENVVNAAKEAGVKHVIYTSFERRNETESSPIAMVAESHIKTENWLKTSGMIYTILKHNVYMDMVPLFIGDQVLEKGTIYLPAGEGKAGFTSRKDMAEAGAVILTSNGHENKEYDITSDVAVSYGDIATMLSDITGKEINYVSPSRKEFTETLSKAGVPREYIEVFAGFSEAISQGELNQTNNFIESLTGKKPLTMKQFLQQTYADAKITQ